MGRCRHCCWSFCRVRVCLYVLQAHRQLHKEQMLFCVYSCSGHSTALLTHSTLPPQPTCTSPPTCQNR